MPVTPPLLFIQPTLPKGQAGRPADEFEIVGGDEKPEPKSDIYCHGLVPAALGPIHLQPEASQTMRGGDVMVARVVPDGLSRFGDISGASCWELKCQLLAWYSC